jgi:hypothetical protein
MTVSYVLNRYIVLTGDPALPYTHIVSPGDSGPGAIRGLGTVQWAPSSIPSIRVHARSGMSFNTQGGLLRS